LAAPVLTPSGAQGLRVGEIEERRETRVDPQHHVAAVTTVATVGAAARHVLLAAEAGAAVAAVACLDPHAHLVDELHDRADRSPTDSPATKMLPQATSGAREPTPLAHPRA